ncbi:hypothetical protein KI387_009468 [Taxus chinensis]|uniref:Uncharacterized protein n=1 Tax=Taxus chinensis TaxID=29808 RepID=A0AA38FG49_TAXCH|nr:hypothetical protein KI387_009468 [Taxus chinensis]
MEDKLERFKKMQEELVRSMKTLVLVVEKLVGAKAIKEEATPKSLKALDLMVRYRALPEEVQDALTFAVFIEDTTLKGLDTTYEEEFEGRGFLSSHDKILSPNGHTHDGEKSAVKEGDGVIEEEDSVVKRSKAMALTPIVVPESQQYELFNVGAVQFLMNLPLRLLSTLGNLLILHTFTGPLTFLFGSSTTDKDEEKDGTGSSVETPPMWDELDIPFVADLYSAGVKFIPTDGDLTKIRFDQTPANLYLPKLKLDANIGHSSKSGGFRSCGGTWCTDLHLLYGLHERHDQHGRRCSAAEKSGIRKGCYGCFGCFGN